MREARLVRLRAVVLALALALGVGGGSIPASAQEASGGRAPDADPAAALEAYDPLFDDPEEAPAGLDADPLETGNRHIFAFNRQVDRWVLDPITDGYQFLVPGPVRRSVNRVILNVNAPVIFANQVLQLRPRAAARTVGRFVANTTLGVAGIFDFAGEAMGLPRTDADFGQTLSRYGIPSGAYLMIPVLGPTTARDAVGSAVDYLLDPITYLVGPLNLEWQLALGGGEGLAIYESHEQGLDALRGSSVDFYAAMRSAYLQSRRAAEIEARSESCFSEPEPIPPPPPLEPEPELQGG